MEISKKGIIIIFIVTLLIALAVTLFIIRDKTEEIIVPEIHTEAFDLVKSMGAGWNLGNTLDTINKQKIGIWQILEDKTPEEYYETLWGNPVTTIEMIESIAQMGFGAVRVPVTYADHLHDDFTIREGWLKRVEEVVNYVLDNNMYCIINLHSDAGSGNWPWLRADLENIDWMEDKLAIVWKQIAEYFKDYGDKLLFEGFNEILDVESNWSAADKSSYDAVNRLNQTFINAVRSTDGNNAERYLIVTPYAASCREKEILDAFVIPNDTAEGRLIIELHYYGSHAFSQQQEEINWTTTYSNWIYERDGQQLEDILKHVKKTFIDKGVPVIIGEFGAKNKNNTEDRIKYVEHYVKAAKQYGIACFWWDDGGRAEDAESVKNFAILDRYRNQWHFPEIAEAIVKAAK